MTPELRISCEVVFQEHKTSAIPISWKKDAFRGRMSIGLCAMAKETLVEKKIIYFPKKDRKTITLLNPVVANAANFEEAVEMIQNKVSFAVPSKTEEPAYIETAVSSTTSYADKRLYQLVKNTGTQQAAIVEEKWYLKPLFFYFIWPISSLVISVLIAYLLSASVEMMYR